MRAVPERPSHRRGVALVVALAMIALAGALLAGTAATARVASRQAQSRESAALVTARWRTDVATFVAALDSTVDTLAVGAEVRQAIGPSAVGTTGETALTTLRFTRTGSRHYLLSATTQLGPDAAVRARRHAALLLVFAPATGNSASRVAPAPPAQWSLHLLY